jgi:hypothetical protein
MISAWSVIQMYQENTLPQREHELNKLRTLVWAYLGVHCNQDTWFKTLEENPLDPHLLIPVPLLNHFDIPKTPFLKEGDVLDLIEKTFSDMKFETLLISHCPHTLIRVTFKGVK